MCGSIKKKWFVKFFKRQPVKLIGGINIHVYALIEAVGWVAYNILLGPILGHFVTVLGMLVLGMMFHVTWYAKQAVKVREFKSIEYGYGCLTWRQKTREFLTAVVHHPTVPDKDWGIDIDLRIWYPAIYRFIWLTLSVAYVLYQISQSRPF